MTQRLTIGKWIGPAGPVGRWGAAIALAASLLLSPTLRAEALPPLTLTTESYPPNQMMINGQLAGVVTDKVREMMARTHIDYRIVVLPWLRAYSLAQTQANYCVFNTAHTPDRDKLFKWVEPTTYADWTLFGLASRKFDIDNLEDARRYVIGTYNGDIRDSYLKERGFIVDTAIEESANPRKLVAQRIDLWAANRLVAADLLRKAGLTKQVVPVHTFFRVTGGLACSLATPDATITSLRQALASMISDGTTAKIEQRYANWQPDP
ncbi:substrate-binding periplasmic protein [Pseudogulbenkiania ferrooxidans]|nr:transporter substrate-binding domain-containing protein [Pseudogulbenkiania ferrooxidans]